MNNLEQCILSVLNEMAKSKPKKKTTKDLQMNIARGAEFALAGAGKSGLMQVDRKDFKKKKQRKDGKADAKKAMRGDY